MPASERARRAGRIAARALPGLALALLAAGALLLLPRFPRGPAPLDVVVLDLSASVARTRPGLARHARERIARAAAEAQAAGARLLVVGFARDVVRLHGPADPSADAVPPAALAPAPGADLGSDLAGALELVERQAERAGLAVRALHLAGDRTATGADPAPALARLAAGGARVRWEEPPPPELADVAVLALELPDAVEPGAPVSLSATLRLLAPPHAAPEELELEVRVGAHAPVRRRQAVPPEAAGGAPWSVRVPLGPAPEGRTPVHVRARIAGGDPLPENDARAAELRAGDALQVAVVASSGAAAEAERLAGALGTLPGLAAGAVGTEALAAALASGAVLVTLDVDPRELPAAALESHVRRGGVWISLAGWRWLEGWSAGGALAPIAALVPAADGDAEREVVLLADGSGSMVGEPFSRLIAAAARLAAAAPPRDRLVLRVFTGALGAPVEVRATHGRGGRGEAAAALLAARAPGGPTDIPGALRALAQEPAERPRIALLLSDGRDQRASEDELERLRSALAGARTRLVVVALGERADTAFLRRLAGPGGDLHAVLDDEQLDHVFRQELRRELWREAPELALRAAVEPADSRLAEELRRAYGSVALPPARRIARATLADGAERLWVDDAGAPALAVRRAGLGHAAAFASGPAADWAPAWSADAGWLAPLVRTLGRGGRSDVPPALVIGRGGLRLTGAAAAWPALVSARLEPWPPAPSAEPAEVVMSPPATGPDPASRREGELPAGLDPAASAWSATLSAPDGTVLATLLAPAPGPEELEHPPRLVPLPDPTDREPASRPGPHPAGPPILAAGLVLLAAAAAGPRLARRPRGTATAGQASRPAGR